MASPEQKIVMHPFAMLGNTVSPRHLSFQLGRRRLHFPSPDTVRVRSNCFLRGSRINSRAEPLTPGPLPETGRGEESEVGILRRDGDRGGELGRQRFGRRILQGQLQVESLGQLGLVFDEDVTVRFVVGQATLGSSLDSRRD